MKLRILAYIILALLLMGMLSACSPDKENTGTEILSPTSAAWIPFMGIETVTFIADTAEMDFTGQGRTSAFENVRYSSDQSGFFSIQTDLYADLERQYLQFKSEETSYIIKYNLYKDKGESGTWDILRVSITDEEFYNNELKIVVYESDNVDKGEIYSFSSSMNLGGQVFKDVYFLKQDSRPFELYYNKEYGVVGFKIAANELWVLKIEE